MNQFADPRRAVPIAQIPVAVLELLRFAVITRFRFRGRYWAWRMHTALGHAPSNTRGRARAAIEYGLWIRKMRRIAAESPSSSIPVASGRSR